ncbi:hypothetical protein A0256_23075 [Mucilaginibacter sp. PAMC 26640]|nr:hypothetical protein A0256_23075 [Mucilaginibacter sp. PAMC 26640]
MKNIKYYAIGVCALILLSYFGYKFVENTQKLADKEQTEKSVKKAIQKEATEIKRQVDKKGIESVLFDITGNKGTIDQLMSNEGTKGIIDTTAMALDLRTKQLKEVLVIKSTLEANNLQLRRQLDSSKRVFYTYNGNGLKLKFTPPNALDSNSVATADFTANVNIKATQYWKRSWILGAKKSILSVTSDNPMFKINGADYVEFEQKQPTFGLRLQGNSSYNFETGEAGFGPAARLDIGRFSIQGRLTKYVNTPGWSKSINASYDLVRF